MAAAKKGGPVGAITRKIGPLPLWAWFVGALAGYYVYTKLSGSSQSSSAITGSGNPGAAATDNSGAPGAGSGGTPADNMSGDLLSALLQGQAQSEQSLIDALNAAYAQTSYYASGYGGYANAAPGSVAQAGAAQRGATVNQPATQSAPTNQQTDAVSQPVYQTDTYQPSTGVYTTPEQVAIAPTVSYSDSPGGVTGPSIFAFKGTDNYSASTVPSSMEHPAGGPGRMVLV